jgi:hypothetical protein
LWSHHDEINHHRRCYAKAQLVDHLTQAGFQVTYTSFFNSLLFPAVAGVRALQKLAGFKDDGSDLGQVPGPLNAALTALFALEARAMPAFSLPVGVSLIAVAQRR